MKLPPERCFHFPDGTSTSSLDELRDKIETISYNTFYHHVDSSKNDFASWIRYVLKDPRLADELEKVNSIVETVEILNDYLHPSTAKQRTEHDDLQSQIEEQIGFVVDDLSEPAPPTEPVPEIPTITEEKIAEITLPEQTTTEADPVAEPVEHETQELDKQEPVPQEPGKQESDKSEKRVPRPQKTFHLRRQQGELNEIDHFHDDMSRLIVKDFIWGLLFGLIVGFLLARMLAL